jgi:hypothetical protein
MSILHSGRGNLSSARFSCIAGVAAATYRRTLESVHGVEAVQGDSRLGPPIELVEVRRRNAKMLDSPRTSACEGFLSSRIGQIGDQTPWNRGLILALLPVLRAGVAITA